MNEYLEVVKKSNNPFNQPQPQEWIKTKKSEVTGEEYEFNDIELIEDILTYFGKWGYEIKNTYFVQDKFGISVTVEVALIYTNEKGEKNVSFGIASEFSPNTKYLTLATPKAASMAFKNAAKKIGRLLGKDLNRGIENNDLPFVLVEKVSKQTTQERVIAQISKCKNIEELESYKLLSNSDEVIKEAYTNKYTQFLKEKF